MTDLLHAHFLQSDEAYTACTTFWRELLESVVLEVGCDAAEWQPWLPQHFVNGTPFAREDLPILEARNSKLNRALRVQQWEATPDDKSGALAAWLDDYSGFDQTFPSHELFLSVLLDDTVADVARRILREWCRPDIDLDQFKAFIAVNRVPNAAAPP